MNLNKELGDYAQAISAVAPAPGALAGAWISMAHFARLRVLIGMDATDEDITVTPEQATDGSGTGAKALNVATVSERYGSANVHSRTAFTPAATRVLVPGANQGIAVFDIKDTDLDSANDFTHVRVSLAGSTALTGRVQSLQYILDAAGYSPASEVDSS